MVTDSHRLAPKIQANGIGLELGSIEGGERFTRKDESWSIQGSKSENSHSWILIGDRTRAFPLPFEFRVGAIVEHQTNPFILTIKIKGGLGGFWFDKRYAVVSWLSQKSNRSLVRRKQSGKFLSVEMLNNSVQAKNVEIMEGSSATKVKRVIEEYGERRITNEALPYYAKKA
jgi:hypothetical protein